MLQKEKMAHGGNSTKFARVNRRLVFALGRTISIYLLTFSQSVARTLRQFGRIVSSCCLIFSRQIGQNKRPVSFQSKNRLQEIAEGPTYLHSKLFQCLFCRNHVQIPYKQTRPCIIGSEPQSISTHRQCCRGLTVGSEKRFAHIRSRSSADNRLPCFLKAILHVVKHWTENGCNMCHVHGRRTAKHQNL